MNYTENYQLPQWVESDRVLMSDFNDMSNKLDVTLGEIAADMSNKGNCQIYSTSYIGTGGNGQGSPNTLTFPKPPVLVMISGGQANSWGHYAKKTVYVIQGGHLFSPAATSCSTWPTTWSADGKTVSWYSVNSSADEQMNASGTTYTVTALLPM